MRARLRRVEDTLAAAEGAMLVAFLAVMVTLAFAQVVLRGFGHGLLWGETVLKQLVLWSGFLGGALAAHQEKHFAWEAAHLGAPARWKPVLRLVAHAAASAVTFLLIKASWAYLLGEMSSSAGLLHAAGISVPAWVAAAGIPAGFALMGTHFLFKTADAALEVMGR